MSRHEVYRTGSGTVRETLDDDGDRDVSITAIDRWDDYRCICGEQFDSKEEALEHIQE